MPEARPRLRDLGIQAETLSFLLPPGPRNDITDVRGVQVGHFTLMEGDSIRTGATAILPHPGSLFQEKVPAGVMVGNGFGKLVGSTQIEELGEIETPILLTNTLAVPRAADAILDWTLSQPGNETVISVNPVVGETNDGWLNDIRRRSLTVEMCLQAIQQASDRPIEEGAVGAGTGTTCLGWKGGIGSSSRRLPLEAGGYTLGVLVQTNFGGSLRLAGIAVNEFVKLHSGNPHKSDAAQPEGGSILILLATDAPLSGGNLKRLAWRAFGGLARTGAALSGHSGDYAIAFSTAESVHRTPARRAKVSSILETPNDRLSALFQAAIEATEEAIYNSLLKAESMRGYQGRMVEALPVDLVRRLVTQHFLKEKP